MECEYAWEKNLSYSTSFVITAFISYIYLCTGVIVWRSESSWGAISSTV